MNQEADSVFGRVLKNVRLRLALNHRTVECSLEDCRVMTGKVPMNDMLGSVATANKYGDKVTIIARMNQ